MSEEIKSLEQAVLELERRKREDPLEHVYTPHVFQQEIHRSRSKVTLTLGGNRCQPPGTRVLTDRGYIPIEEVRVGDTVPGYGAKKNTVEVVHSLDPEPIFEIVTKRGYTVRGNAEHPFYSYLPTETGWHSGVNADRSTGGFRRIDELEKGMYLKLAPGGSWAWPSECEPTEDDAYFLGLMTGDGSWSYDYGVMKFSSNDQELHDWVSAYLDQRGIPSRLFEHESRADSLEWCNLDFKDQVREWGVTTENTTKLKEIPGSIWSATKSVTAAFLRGLFDADGCGSDKPAAVFVSTSEGLARNVHILLTRFGIRASLYTQEPRIDWKRPSVTYRLQITGRACGIFKEQIGFGLQRKQDMIQDAHSGQVSQEDRIAEIREVGTQPLVGLTIGPEPHYISDGFLSHNTGKTYSAVAEALLYCLGRSTYAEVPEGPNHVWYVVPTSSIFDDAVEPILDELMPWDRVVHHDKRKNRYKFDNGSVLAIKSSDQRQKRLVGANVDFVVADEPMPKKVYEELMARLISTGGRMLMVLTPVSEKIDEWLWVRDELYVPWQIGERKDVDVIFMPVVDEDGNPAVPHLTKKQVEQMERQYPDPETRAARMYGEFIVRGGLVFSGFDPEVNLIKRFEIPPHWHRWLICDPQYHRFAVLFFAADERGNYYVTDEYFSSDEPMAVRADRIKEMVGPQDRAVPMYVDYANPQDIQELNYHFSRNKADIGAVQLPVTKQVEKMVLRVHAMLEPNKDRPYHEATPNKGVYGAPRLIIFKDLQSVFKHDGRRVVASRLLWEMKRLSWGKRNKPDKSTAAGADCVDCLIYGCSIMAIGTPSDEPDDWRYGLSARDQTLWEAIDQQDRRQEIGIQHPQ